MILPRMHTEARLRKALEQSPVTVVLGPRQCGKTTLARQIHNERQSHYFDLEDPDDLLRLTNPKLALEPLEGLVVIDEIQRRPDLFPLLRVLVDCQKRRGHFLLLGSASPDLLKQSSETLAGRIEFIELGGFALYDVGELACEQLWERGGFPRSYLATDYEASVQWRRNFIKTFLERDIPQLGIRVSSETLRRFWQMLAHRHAQLLNSSELGRSLAVSDHTIRHYLDILVATFMMRTLTPWHANIEKRQVKSPKLYFRDSGLLHSLLNLRSMDELRGHPALGSSWEGFALEQIVSLLEEWSTDFYFWGTHSGAELDLLSWLAGKPIGFEFKYTDQPKVTRSMHSALQDLSLEKLYIVHPGTVRQPIHEKIELLPLLDALELLNAY